MSRKGKIAISMTVGLMTLLAGTVAGLSNISFAVGRVASYDFGSSGPGHPVPGTVQIQGFILKPGDTIPWHYHKGPSYVILERGTLTEQHLVGTDQCMSMEVTAGTAFVEPPGRKHTVSNTGNDAALIWWATVFPESDGIVQFSPEFKAGGLYPVDPPSCN